MNQCSVRFYFPVNFRDDYCRNIVAYCRGVLSKVSRMFILGSDSECTRELCRTHWKTTDFHVISPSLGFYTLLVIWESRPICKKVDPLSSTGPKINKKVKPQGAKKGRFAAPLWPGWVSDFFCISVDFRKLVVPGIQEHHLILPDALWKSHRICTCGLPAPLTVGRATTLVTKRRRWFYTSWYTS